MGLLFVHIIYDLIQLRNDSSDDFNIHVLFVAIIVVLALCVYFTIYRLGWGVSECMNKNYHNCAALLTPEVAPLALTGLAALI